MSQTANPALERKLMDVPVRVDVVLGDVRIDLEDLLALAPGDVIALQSSTSDDVDIYVSDRLLAHGKLVIADGELGVTLSEIVDGRRAA